MSMQARWYIARKQVEYGPFSAQQLAKLLNDGKLKVTDQVRQADTDQYVQARTLEWLFPQAADPESPMLVPDEAPLHVLNDETLPTEAMGPLSLHGMKVRPNLTLTFGDFQILNKIGSGGMGAVYLAFQRSQNRRVAIKMLASNLAGNLAYVHRFYREAMVLGQLQHPNIVRFHGVGEEKGIPFFAMEYINGLSVSRLLARLGKVSIGDALHIVLRCAEALGHGHAHNIIHRDVKPGNILITRARIVKLTDLGLAKPLDDDLNVTDSGMSMGTPKYAAPEQSINAKNADHRSDIYSLGASLYHMVVGAAPFKGETAMEVQMAKEQSSFVPARRLNPDVCARLDLLIDKMLARDPRYRYQSCKEVVSDIEALGAHNRRLSFDIDRIGGAEIESPLTPIRQGLVEILLVHEDAEDIRLAQQALEERHMAANLNIVKDGLEALNFLRREGIHAAAPRPHLIILGADVHQPATLAVLDTLRQDSTLSDIPLVVLARETGTVEFLRNQGFNVQLTVSDTRDLDALDNLIDSVSGLSLTVVQRRAE